MTALDDWCQTHGATYSARWEFTQVIDLVLNYRAPDRPRYGRPHVVLELGAHQGASMRIWAEAFEPSFLIGVEAEQTPRTQEPLAQMCEDTGAGVIFGDTCAPETLRYVEHFLDGLAVDFLYIDADHRFESVSKDFHTYAPLVRDGGLIVLDDAVTRDNPTTEVYQLVAQLKQRGPTSLIYGGGDSGGKLAVFR